MPWAHSRSVPTVYYIIKFIGFILIYYVINLNIVSSFMIFNNLYLESIDLLQITSLNQ